MEKSGASLFLEKIEEFEETCKKFNLKYELTPIMLIMILRALNTSLEIRKGESK